MGGLSECILIFALLFCILILVAILASGEASERFEY